MQTLSKAGLAAIVGCGTACLVSPLASGEQREYCVAVDVTWSEATHPGLVPFDAHLSWFGGALHNDQVWFWRVGELASPGVTDMAERGHIGIMIEEVDDAIADGTAFTAIDERRWFCPPSTDLPPCGSTVFTITVDSEYPLLTLASMLGPSPDWFVGVDSIPLYENGVWLEEAVIPLTPYDGGTRDANVLELFGPQTMPQQPVTIITAATGQIIGPGALGTMTITLVSECPADLNADGAHNATDINLFVSAFLSMKGAADLNADGAYSATDINLFVTAFLAGCD